MPYTPQQTAIISALAAASRAVPVHWVADMRTSRKIKRVQTAFAEAEARTMEILGPVGLDPSSPDLPYVAAEAIRTMRHAQGGFDPRGGTAFDQAINAAARIANALAVVIGIFDDANAR